MSEDKENQRQTEPSEEADAMNVTIERYCPISESIIESCKEVKLIREGKLPKKTWKELREELKKIKDEDNN